MRALILGGGSCVWDDIRALGTWDGLVIAVNDVGCVYPYPVDHWCSLHAEKLAGWALERKGRGFDMTFTTWTRPEREGADRQLAGWSSGSSGMFAVGVALELGAESVVLAGVPMEPRPHFFDATAWTDFANYRGAWEKRADRLRGRVYSMSGWTRDLLSGPPWLEPARTVTLTDGAGC